MVDFTPSTLSGSSFTSTSPKDYDASVDEIYKVETTNLYKAKPYGFVFWDRGVVGPPALPAGIAGPLLPPADRVGDRLSSRPRR